MAYKQNPGRGPMMKTGRGDAIAYLTDNDKKQKMVQVKATGGGESWMINVAEGSNMHKMAKKLGAVPEEFRNLKGVTKDLDPWAINISPKEQDTRMEYWANKNK